MPRLQSEIALTVADRIQNSLPPEERVRQDPRRREPMGRLGLA